MESLGWCRQSLSDVLQKFTSISTILVESLIPIQQRTSANNNHNNNNNGIQRRTRTQSWNNNNNSATCHDRSCQQNLNNNNNENQRNYHNADIINHHLNNNNGLQPIQHGAALAADISNIYEFLVRDLYNRTRTMNAIVLSCVFFLGVLSAVFFTILLTFNGSGEHKKSTFQPLPHVVDLQLTDEGFMDPLHTLSKGHPMKELDNECDPDNPLGFELEAVSSLHLAMEMKEMGKLAKAQKLFQHAMALCPRHPDILTNYGEFYEKSHDFMMADHLYVQALTYAPHHTKALVNRKRTLPVVEELDERRLKRIDGKREQLLQLPDSSYALRRIRKEAYFQHIYHSAGIEGNTMTLSQTRQILETRLAVGGKSIIEHNEILGLDAALRFINTTLVNRIGYIRVEDILAIHRHLMGFVDPEEAGKFRRTQVFVGNHVPPRPDEITTQMEQFIEWLNSEEALSLHPIHYSAIAHYKLVYIHPFLDGNGRTSRLLMNWILMQADYPAVIIRKQDRQLYYDHLNTANKGDVRPFIRFIADCTEKTVDVYLWATREHFYQILELEEEAKAIEQLKDQGHVPVSSSSSSTSSHTDGEDKLSHVIKNSNKNHNEQHEQMHVHNNNNHKQSVASSPAAEAA